MGTKHLIWAIISFLCVFRVSLVENTKINIRHEEKKILDQLLNKEYYDARIRPSGVNGTDGAVLVYVNLFVRSLSKIDDVNMEYSVQLTFREKWLDERLKFDNLQGRIKYLTLTERNRTWMPDLFFSNEKEGHFHDILTPNFYLRIFPTGDVLYSTRISLTLSCPMNLKFYPLDTQICSMRMASYGWTTDDIVFLWKEGDPVQVVRNLHTPHFTLQKFSPDYCNSKTNTGEYSCIKVDFLLKRELSYYLTQIYIPYSMLVMVSWVSFWLDQSAVTARVLLGLTTLLTMTVLTFIINASMPVVSYTKAIDIWTCICLAFVLGALLEFVTVNYLSHSAIQEETMGKKQRDQEPENLDATVDILETENNGRFAVKKPLMQNPDDLLGDPPQRQNWCAFWLCKIPRRSIKIDVISRIIFPLAFVVFNLVYWSTHLFGEYDDE